MSGNTRAISGDIVSNDFLSGKILSGKVLSGTVLSGSILSGGVLSGENQINKKHIIVKAGEKVLSGIALSGNTLSGALLSGNVLSGKMLSGQVVEKQESSIHTGNVVLSGNAEMEKKGEEESEKVLQKDSFVVSKKTVLQGHGNRVVVEIPSGTKIMSRGGKFSLSDVDVSNNSRKQSFFRRIVAFATSFGARSASVTKVSFDFGVKGKHLVFSKPVKLRVPVSGVPEGEYVDFAVMHEGDS